MARKLGPYLTKLSKQERIGNLRKELQSYRVDPEADVEYQKYLVRKIQGLGGRRYITPNEQYISRCKVKKRKKTKK